MNDVCMFSSTTLTYKCRLEIGIKMYIGLRTKCFSIWLMLGVYDVYVTYTEYMICVNVDLLLMLCAFL